MSGLICLTRVSVCLSITFLFNTYLIDLKFCTDVENAKLEGSLEDEENVWKNQKVVVVLYPPRLLLTRAKQGVHSWF